MPGPSHVERARVAWVDTDAGGRIHFTAAFRWAEAAETALGRRLGLLDEWGDLPRRAVEAEYLAVLRFEDEIEVELRPERVGDTSVTYSWEIRRDGEVCVRGRHTAVHVDAEGRPAPLPETMRRTLTDTTIEGVGTSTAAFVGPTTVGPTDGPVLLTSLPDFEQTYGDGRPLTFAGTTAPVDNYMWHGARAFFENGGKRLYVQRVAGLDGQAPTGADYTAGLQRLEQTAEIAVVAAPGAQVSQELVEHAELTRYRFAVLDPPSGQTVEEVSRFGERLSSSYAALYYPWVRARDPAASTEIALPPSAFVAGIYARVDTNQGVSRAPANERLIGALDLEATLSDEDAETLSSNGINPLRALGGGQARAAGARTLSSDPDWKYVNIRRYVIYLEHSIDRGTQWAVFEPNGETLWAAVRASITDFLLNEFRSGAMAGNTPEEAFFVKCDRSTMTQNDLDNGRLVCEIGVAPLRPAEFVIFRIGQWTADHRDDDD